MLFTLSQQENIYNIISLSLSLSLSLSSFIEGGVIPKSCMNFLRFVMNCLSFAMYASFSSMFCWCLHTLDNFHHSCYNHDTFLDYMSCKGVYLGNSHVSPHNSHIYHNPYVCLRSALRIEKIIFPPMFTQRQGDSCSAAFVPSRVGVSIFLAIPL